ncbi:MAG: hypothetical protein EOO25_15845 [Comamonadaceae bacterium]|nr:MAG: hypothetical protein EOO25_15845 [Comamonadaceae bacterium]
MQNRRPSRPRQGNTLPQGQNHGQSQDTTPRLPHERDESADSQPSAEASAQRVGRQAHADVVQGQQDTGRKPAMDAAYEKQKR